MSNQQLKKTIYKIQGMHCAACEVAIERKFKAVSGVEKVNVNHATGRAELQTTRDLQVSELESVIKEDGYGVAVWSKNKQESLNAKEAKGNYLEIIIMAAVIWFAYFLLKKLNILPPGWGVSDNMSYGFIFALGLVAAVSTCMAVSGGLLLALAAKYNEAHPNLSGLKKFQPHLYFNLGRIISYTVLGAVVGALGGILTLSQRASGIITIIASLVMMALGFQILKIFPGLKRVYPRLPKTLAHKIHDWSEGENKFGSFILGALTFFLPCGFTQALQLYVLAQGQALVGALAMLAFALGTLPALLSIGALTSFTKGTFHKYFLKFVGVLVIFMGLFNISSGWSLLGLTQFNSKPKQSLIPKTEIIGNKQIATMRIVGLDYYPAQFTVKQGVPVEWEIDGSQASGCARVIVSAGLGINEYLPTQGSKKFIFTPKKTGFISFSCPMGMTTRGAGFVVVPN